MERLARPRHPLLLAALAVALCLPALGLGFQLDDHYLRLALSRPPLEPAWSRPAMDVFAFFRGDAAFTRAVRDQGTVPWWTAEDLRLAFWRPVSGLTHGLDFLLWPRSPVLMHIHSLLWLGACVAAAARLFRRLDLAPAVAGLAGLLFALDDGHGTPAVWIANRNALVATFFGLLCLIAHDRWRRDGWRAGAWLAPLCLLLGLLSGETALAIGGYLLGYALFIERGTWRARALSLAPAAGVGLAWALLYHALGYGTHGSSVYLDPLASPTEFLGAFVAHAPVLLFGQFALPADLNGLLSSTARVGLWLVACVFAVLTGVLALPLLRRDRLARVFAAGLLLSLVPASATFPSNRLLLLTSLGGAGLLAQWLHGVRREEGWLPRGRAWRAVARGAWWPALVLHVGLAPLGLWGAADGVRMLGELPTRAAASLPRDAALSSQHVLIINTPSAFFSAQSLLEHLLAGDPMPARAHVLGSGVGATRVTRPDASSLLVEPAGGFLAPPGSVVRDASGVPAPFDRNHMLSIFDRLYRGAEPFRVGRRIAMKGLEAEIVTVTRDGRPAAVRFRLEQALEAPAYRWVQWRAGAYAPFDPPPVGATLELPPAEVWPAG